MKKLLFLFFGVFTLFVNAQFSSADGIVEFSKNNYSEKKAKLIKNGWKKNYVEPISGLESVEFVKVVNGVKHDIIIRSGVMPTSRKIINSTILYVPKSKIVEKYLDGFEAKYNFKMIAENVIGYSEKGFSITISLGTDDDGSPLHEIKIINTK